MPDNAVRNNGLRARLLIALAAFVLALSAVVNGMARAEGPEVTCASIGCWGQGDRLCATISQGGQEIDWCYGEYMGGPPD